LYLFLAFSSFLSLLTLLSTHKPASSSVSFVSL
jgi:hypothetical protein